MYMGFVKKRGLSPVIATTLLISIAVILAIIIFIWARSFVSEQVEKLGEPVERACENIIFEVEVDTDNAYVVNKGNVPIYGISILKKKISGTKEIGEAVGGDANVNSGETIEIPLDEQVDSGDSLIIVPIVLGETNNYKKQYKCKAEDYGLEVEVI